MVVEHGNVHTEMCRLAPKEVTCLIIRLTILFLWCGDAGSFRARTCAGEGPSCVDAALLGHKIMAPGSCLGFYISSHGHVAIKEAFGVEVDDRAPGCRANSSMPTTCAHIEAQANVAEDNRSR